MVNQSPHQQDGYCICHDNRKPEEATHGTAEVPGNQNEWTKEEGNASKNQEYKAPHREAAYRIGPFGEPLPELPHPSIHATGYLMGKVNRGLSLAMTYHLKPQADVLNYAGFHCFVTTYLAVVSGRDEEELPNG